MTPTISEALLGNFMSLIEPPPPDSAGEFMAGKIAVTAMISLLAAQEAEKGAAVRIMENRAMRALFADAAEGGWDPDLNGRLQELARGEDRDFNITALDRANAELRIALIALQTVVEEAPAAASHGREKRIIKMLHAFADARRLDLPPMPAQ